MVSEDPDGAVAATAGCLRGEVSEDGRPPFELLHPALQHHIVNSLGWRSLRPHQESAIPPILLGEHVLVQAPTAGGKTEAALFPTMSRMLSEEWSGLGVLYLCPIKALLNDLEVRIERLAAMVGRRVAVWHGDIGASARRRIVREPPDILLATPESVEVMLVSRLVDHERLFSSLKCVIVDEVHAFAGDDRGWHLLSLLERVAQLSQAPVQRVALSATLANAENVLHWFVSRQSVPRRVVATPPSALAEVDLQVDFVGNLPNAALVLSRLHAGEKRLVFCDSRSQVEALALELRALRVRTFVSHSSLSLDERRRAETAFAQESDCVIVATSTLELGIDVGDLDRVVQIDAPPSVAAFLQRLGRSGRRTGTRRNCLFLATREDALLQALGVLHLWAEGFVEPVSPPARPYHVLAQQVLACLLQEEGVAGVDLKAKLRNFRWAAAISDEDWDRLLANMLEEGILFQDGGILGVGREGEAKYGRKHFLELFSIFLAPPLFTVLHGNQEIGQVHELTFSQARERPILLALGGRGWRVRHIDWSARRAFVEPTDTPGRSRWLGSGQPMHFELAQAIKRVLAGADVRRFLSKRAESQLQDLTEEFVWLREAESTLLLRRDEPATWWTFAGDRYNSAVAAALRADGISAQSGDLRVLVSGGDQKHLPETVAAIARRLAENPAAMVTCEGAALPKFGECVPESLLQTTFRERLAPRQEAAALAAQSIRARM
jgi:ATP-dependent Lhr-like helicase